MGAKAGQFAHDHLHIADHIFAAAGIGDVDEMYEQARALDVPQELGAQTSSGVCPFNEARDICNYKADLVSGIAHHNYSQVRLQGCEWVVGDLGMRRRNARDQGGLSDVRISDQAHIVEQF